MTESFHDIQQSVDTLPGRISDQLSVKMSEWAATLEQVYRDQGLEVSVVVELPPPQVVVNNQIQVRQEFVPYLNCPVRLWGPCPTPAGSSVFYVQPCP